MNYSFLHKTIEPPELDPHDALAVELARVDQLFSNHLARLRKRGRTILGDAIGGAVIEEGEAEGLLQSLHETHSSQKVDNPALLDDWTSPLEPLEKARKLYDLLPEERDLLLLALSVEIDSRYARLVAFLNDHVKMTRPTLGLATAVLLPTGQRAHRNLIERLVNDGPLLRYSLLDLQGDEPFSNKTLVVPSRFWPRLIGKATTPPFKIKSLSGEQLSVLELPKQTHLQAQKAQDWALLQSPDEVLILIAGRVESGRETLACSIAAGLYPNAIVISGADFENGNAVATIEREARWHEAVVIVRDPEQIQPKIRIQLLEQLSVPVIYTAIKEGKTRLMHESRRRIVEVPIEDRGLNDRARLWNRLLEGTAQSISIDTPALAARFGFGPSRIVSATRLASTFKEFDGRRELHQFDLEAACRSLQEVQFGSLAQKLQCPFTDQDIILPAKTRQELDLIVAWANHGARVFGTRGPGQQLHTGHGLACLFSGPPGTGKTMAAQVIARRINFDLYRIDLSQVVNKYIGETEKNLSKVFDEAQRAKVILFFDEADTLFGRRSEVKDAHDRYANIEIGYLLQRLESYEGLAILATNFQKNLDDAFLRRLQVTAEFPMPVARERRAIWKRLLPDKERNEQNIDLELLSDRFEVAGGDIRNAIFTALLLAAEDDSLLGMRHLVLGLWRELQKTGRVVDLAHFGECRREIEAAVDRQAVQQVK
jgi:DNA polymerase III delta prime subunit